jgi:oligoribonuclease (3'-5' exoribonuclease)
MHGEMDTRPVVWGGFSPSALDRPLVRLFMPTFYNMIHYRTIDVSTTKLTALNFFGVKIEREAPRHRAEGDTEATLDTFRRITSLISEKTGRCEKVEPFTAAQAK